MATATQEEAGRLSTAPAVPRRPGPGRRVTARMRYWWRQLTSMRTALVLLLILAIAAIPGSVLPQRDLNPLRVDRYLEENPGLGRVYDRLGLFDVFASPWFAAVYLLLLLSLVGCLVPRIRLHARALATSPPPAPRNLDRLPSSTRYHADGAPEDVAGAAMKQLRRRRWRAVRRTEDDGVVTVAAEAGYLRETGNLLFHISVVALLLAIAVGKVFSYESTVLVEEGKGFCNTVSQFDSFRSGPWLDRTTLTPFCVDLDSFTATYTEGGTPTSFLADIRYTETLDGSEKRYPLRVNSPLRLDGARLYLIGHGYSPRFTVRDPSGQVFRSVSAPFLPQDGALTSTGALKLTEAKPDQIALEGVFAPSATVQDGAIVSAFPRPDRPAVGIVVYRGDLGLDSGRPQSVYSVDQGQVQRGRLKIVTAKNMLPGNRFKLDDGTEISFDGYTEWASLQVSRDPTQQWVLLAAVAILTGLMLSLSVRRRRIWLRFTPDPDGGTAVDAGGLSRTDRDRSAEEFTGTLRLLQRGSPQMRDP